MTKQFSLKDTYKHKGLRKRLSETVRRKGIKDDRIIAAIEKIPRHFFLDSAFAEQAYVDKAMPIGEEQTISQPFTVAYQTELLNIKKGDRVLEIGTGSGYQACILLELGAVVYTIERIKKLIDKAERLLPEIGYNLKIFHGDGTIGLPKFAPFDKILCTAASPFAPDSLLEQLKIGGILVIPIGSRSSQTMVQITRNSENGYNRKDHELFRFVPLIGKEGWNH